MATLILEERGYFWWHGTPVPDTHFAPDDSVTGHLKISEDGRVELELDGNLPSDKHPLDRLVARDRNLPPELCIQGRLKGSNDHVLLVGLLSNGSRISTNGISYEKYLALGCLVGQSSVPSKVGPGKFKELKINLDGLEEWVRLGGIECKKARSITVKYIAPKDTSYSVGDGRLRVVFDVLAPFMSQKHMSEITLKERASIVLSLRRGVSLDEMKKQFCLTEDLLILLSGSDYCLDWPLVSISPKQQAHRFYFLRHRSGAAAPAFHECWTNFVQLRECFGEIFAAWRTKRDIYGPGFYLYLGTRRGMKLYPEHRFVNLIWGIESLHRSQETAPVEPSGLAKKIERILACIEKPRDKTWLMGRLKNAHEPSLEQRIFDMFKPLPLRFDDARLCEFAKTCARMRNDISHFGGLRQSGDYAVFLRKIERHSNAISTLYAFRILLEIGVDPTRLEWWAYEGFKSYPIKRNFVDVGLLPESAVN